MAIIKSHTNLEQSKKLAEFLSLDSADMSWVSCDNGQLKYYQAENRKIITDYEKSHWFPCWSLAALLNVLPNYVDYDTIRHPDLIRNIDKNYMVIYSPLKHSGIYDNPVDACVDMIIKLHELNLL